MNTGCRKKVSPVPFKFTRIEVAELKEILQMTLTQAMIDRAVKEFLKRLNAYYYSQ